MRCDSVAEREGGMIKGLLGQVAGVWGDIVTWGKVTVMSGVRGLVQVRE